MKAKFETIFRHVVTAIPAFGAGMAAKGWVTAAEGAQIDAWQQDTLVGLAVILAAIAARLLLVLVAKWFPGFENLLGTPQGDSGTKGGGSGTASLLMMTAAAGALLVGGMASLSSCVVGVDENGDWSIRPDPYSIDAALKYAIRHEDSKGWIWVDAETGEPIAPEDLHEYELEAR